MNALYDCKAQPLTDKEIHFLYGKGLLVTKLWCAFRFKGQKEHRYLKWGDVTLKTSLLGVENVEMCERQTKKWWYARSNTKMYATGGNRDPVDQTFFGYKTPHWNNEDSFYIATRTIPRRSAITHVDVQMPVGHWLGWTSNPNWYGCHVYISVLGKLDTIYAYMYRVFSYHLHR